MQTLDFIQDLAIVMLVAGVTTLLFHRLKQPVVLGYILAGVIIGPHTPPVQFIQDQHTIEIFSELGVIFLLFSLGLEFSIKRLASVGVTAFVGAVAEIAVMLWLGYQIGMYFDWGPMNAIFLGAMLSVSSTTIIIKVLDDLGMKRERFAEIIFGILIIEDILAIAMIALLSAIATTGEISTQAVMITLGKLGLFMVVSLVVGILIVPRLLAYAAKFRSDEMLLVTVLGLCFGFCLIVIKLGYSVALGAFVIGAIMAESRQIHQIEKLIAPVRDMFSAVFFVAIGLLLDPNVLFHYGLPILIITLVVVLGKVFACGLGSYVCGHDARTSMRVGMGLSQIGEFSFIIAALGVNLNVTSDFLYPIAVAVSGVTSLLTPYLIRWADPFTLKLGGMMPARLKYASHVYTTWLQNISPQGDRALQAAIIKRIMLQIFINLALITACFLASSYLIPSLIHHIADWSINDRWIRLLVWGITFLVATPFLMAAYGKLKALSMILAEFSVTPSLAGRYTMRVRKVIAEFIPLIVLSVFMIFILILSGNILLTTEYLSLLVVGLAAVSWLLRGRFRHIHTRLQATLIETLRDHKEQEKI